MDIIATLRAIGIGSRTISPIPPGPIDAELSAVSALAIGGHSAALDQRRTENRSWRADEIDPTTHCLTADGVVIPRAHPCSDPCTFDGCIRHGGEHRDRASADPEDVDALTDPTQPAPATLDRARVLSVLADNWIATDGESEEELTVARIAGDLGFTYAELTTATREGS